MAHDFLPGREGELRAWCNAFGSNLSSSPLEFGITVEMAAQYAERRVAFSDLYQAARNNRTRTPAVIRAKDEAKRALVTLTRELARVIQANSSVSNEQRTVLGLTVRRTERTPVERPDQPPELVIRSTSGRRVKILLRRIDDASGRGKPAGVAGATVLSYVGELPPIDRRAWSFEGNTARTLRTVNLPASVPKGARVWFTAVWFNTRMKSGPAATPVMTNLQGGVAMRAA